MCRECSIWHTNGMDKTCLCELMQEERGAALIEVGGMRDTMTAGLGYGWDASFAVNLYTGSSSSAHISMAAR